MLPSRRMAPVTVWLLILAGVLVGALLGAVVALIAMRRAQSDPHSVRSLQRELDAYRGEVTEHYVETARRVDALTHAYKSVYDHLEDGAYRLVGEAELRHRLEDAGSHPVTLEGIGQRVLQRPSDDAAGERGDTRHDDAGRGTSTHPPDPTETKAQDAGEPGRDDEAGTAPSDDGADPADGSRRRS